MTTILIADDDVSLLRIASRALSNLADRIVEVQDGLAAWEALQELDDVCLIVSDWMMPTMDGPELLRRCKADKRLADIPFLLLTARGEDEDVISGFQHGADEYVKKPFSIAELMARCKRLIKIKAVQDNLRSMALSDGLTCLANRRALDEHLASEVTHCRHDGGVFSLLILDIDHFKDFNDSYGHQVGDAVLAEIGQLMGHAQRPGDLAARYGGEEFALLLPDTELEEAVALADQLRERIARHEFEYDGSLLRVTVSLGAAELEAHEDSCGLIKRADDALYQAKQSGRNTVCAAPRN